MVKEMGGKKVAVYTNQKDVIEMLLKLEYSVAPASRTTLKRMLNIKRNVPLPKGKALAELINNSKKRIYDEIIIERRLA